MEQIAILTTGLWRLRREVAVMSGMRPVWWDSIPRPRFSAAAGWGHAATADRARRLAARSGKPYVAFEDGPLRSVKPGPAQPPMGLVMDRTGIYYRAGEPSDLIALMDDRTWFTPEFARRAGAAMAQMKGLRLSKYNAGPERGADAMALGPASSSRVLVLDQVRGDASVAGALADADAFRRMLETAITENPGSEVVIKVHPDVLSGRRHGHFGRMLSDPRVRIVAESLNPWSLLAAVEKVYTVSSGLGFEAALAGKPVICFGAPFYSGWGFTDDRGPALGRRAGATPIELFAAYYLRYTSYFDAHTRQPISFEEAAEQLAWLRDRFLNNPRRAVCFGIARWKRSTIDRMLDGPAGPPLHAGHPEQAARLASGTGGPVVAWASRDLAQLQSACASASVPLVRVEDGFIRSAGLGASFVAPLSLVFDGRGIYYDARQPSDLERLLNEEDFSPELVERARRLRQKLVAMGTTKYNVPARTDLRIDNRGRPVVLVVGQVEDDASIRHGSPRLTGNLELLRAARLRHPDAYLVYKPHPDVEAGFRRGRIPPALSGQHADLMAADASILDLIGACDRLETITSLAGFEALLRGKPVTTHGQPFYAGWGLTEDLCPVARRQRSRSLDELVAAALILYPRYLDPESGLRCEPEHLVQRMADAAALPATRRQHAVRLARNTAARVLHVTRTVRKLGTGA
jgi:capsular polysaccharide export protein